MNNLMSLNGKRKRSMKNINKVFAVMLVKQINQQKTIWLIGTTAIVGDSILNGIMVENLCGQGLLVKVKRFPGSTVGDLTHHIIPII